MNPVDVIVYFNFRSPYCYLASKTMWSIVEDYRVNLIWKPVGGWDLRSPPDRAKVKIPLVRQDVDRIARRMGIPLSPPPMETDPTAAGAASLYAESEGKLREYVIETMRIEWAEGRNIAKREVLAEVAQRIGLDEIALLDSSEAPSNLERLLENGEEARSHGVFGVPTFAVADEFFWGQDRIDYVLDHLRDMRAVKS